MGDAAHNKLGPPASRQQPPHSTILIEVFLLDGSRLQQMDNQNQVGQKGENHEFPSSSKKPLSLNSGWARGFVLTVQSILRQILLCVSWSSCVAQLDPAELKALLPQPQRWTETWKSSAASRLLFVLIPLSKRVSFSRSPCNLQFWVLLLFF